MLNLKIYGSNQKYFLSSILYGYIFLFLNDFLMLAYRVLMLMISLSRLVMISLINVAVFIYIGWIIIFLKI